MFDWAEYLDFARHLVQADTSTEAELRSAISRAYYASFHIARDYLIQAQHLNPLSRQHVHREVWRVLRTNPHLEAVAAAERGFRLLAFRRKADYEGRYPLLSHEARRAIREAEQIIAGISTLQRLGSGS
jgi:uncharacterized protein (UPF0332 family)